MNLAQWLKNAGPIWKSTEHVPLSALDTARRVGGNGFKIENTTATLEVSANILTKGEIISSLFCFLSESMCKGKCSSDLQSMLAEIVQLLVLKACQHLLFSIKCFLICCLTKCQGCGRWGMRDTPSSHGAMYAASQSKPKSSHARSRRNHIQSSLASVWGQCILVPGTWDRITSPGFSCSASDYFCDSGQVT